MSAYSSSLGLCYLVTTLVAAVLAVWGYMKVFNTNSDGLTDTQQLLRQLRGFGFVILASAVAAMGVAFCR